MQLSIIIKLQLDSIAYQVSASETSNVSLQKKTKRDISACVFRRDLRQLNGVLKYVSREGGR